MGVEKKPHRIVDLELPTDADVLALNPTDWLGKVALAFDTKKYYQAVTLETVSPTVDVWQQINPEYNPATDAYCFPSTQDGQTQNVGQEMFFLAYNDNGSGATTLDPKVFLSVTSRIGDEVYQDVLKASASDLEEGDVFGLNTTSLLIGEKGKVVTYGEIQNVNTSAWAVNTLLYVDTVSGDLVNVQPSINAFLVGRVLKSDATTGIIFVNTISSNRIDNSTIAIGFDRIFFTGDETDGGDPAGAGNFFLTKFEDEGLVATATVAVVVPDDSTVASSKDHLSVIFPTANSIEAGLRNGQITFQVDSAGGNEKIYLELYEAQDDGTVVDSGILTNAVGDLGVRPIILFETSILIGIEAGDKYEREFRGELLADYTISLGNRYRSHFLCEKIGSAGGNKTFTLRFGSDEDSWLNALSRVSTDEVINNSSLTGTTLTDALNNIDSSDISNDSTIPGATVTDALDTIATVGVIRDAPGGTMFMATPPDTQLLVSTTPVLIDVLDSTGFADRVTTDPANAIFTLQEAGRYLIGFNFACAAASNNTVITVGIHVNGSGTAAIDIPILARTSGENVPIPFSFPFDGNALDTFDFRISIGAGTQTLTFDEASVYLVQQAVGLATLEGAVEPISHQNEDGTERTYYVGADEIFAGTIDEIRVETDSGTIDYTVKIGGVNVTGLVAVEASSTKTTYTATALNTFVDGDTISYETTGDSASVAPRITIKTSRT